MVLFFFFKSKSIRRSIYDDVTFRKAEHRLRTRCAVLLCRGNVMPKGSNGQGLRWVILLGIAAVLGRACLVLVTWKEGKLASTFVVCMVNK
jgi:hypothetical protein